jgi:hypothetical protein
MPSWEDIFVFLGGLLLAAITPSQIINHPLPRYHLAWLKHTTLRQWEEATTIKEHVINIGRKEVLQKWWPSIY